MILTAEYEGEGEDEVEDEETEDFIVSDLIKENSTLYRASKAFKTILDV